MKDKREQEEKEKDSQIFIYKGLVSWLLRLVQHFIDNCYGVREEFHKFLLKNPVPPKVAEILSDDQKLSLKNAPVLLPTPTVPPQKLKLLRVVSPIQIDGKTLSYKEVCFEEFYSKRFDEEKWLKENKLSIDN
jgi:hypothetical protein